MLLLLSGVVHKLINVSSTWFDVNSKNIINTLNISNVYADYILEKKRHYFMIYCSIIGTTTLDSIECYVK